MTQQHTTRADFRRNREAALDKSARAATAAAAKAETARAARLLLAAASGSSARNHLNESFWEWYAAVTIELYFGRGPNQPHPRFASHPRVPMPTGDTANAEAGSIEAMFNCNYEPAVAASEIIARRMIPRQPLDVREAAMLAYQINGALTSEQFAKGGDAAVRYALREALNIPAD